MSQFSISPGPSPRVAHDDCRSIRTCYLETGGLPEGAERSAILRSWQRCQSGGVDPDLIVPRAGLSGERLAYHCQQQATLLQAAAPLLEELHEGLAGLGAIIHLVDRKGLILDARSDSVTLAHAQEQGLVPGQDWSELAAGTNAIGTALAENRALQVFGEEHYCAGSQQWRCSAAPIHDPRSGELLGVLNMSTTAQRDLDLLLPLISSVACNLEQALLLEFQSARQRLLRHSMHRLSYRDGVVLFDRNGRLVQANRFAVQQLKGLRGDAAVASQSGEITGAPQADPLFRALDPAWLEPLWHRGELLGYLAPIPCIDMRGAGRPVDDESELAPAQTRALAYLLKMPGLRRPLTELLRRWQPLIRASAQLSRPARLQQLLTCSTDLIRTLDAQTRAGASDFDSAKALRATIARFERDCEEPPSIHIDWPSTLRIAGDSRAFCQLLFNLLDNSRAHGFNASSAGQIRIQGAVDGQMLIFTYQDDGRGMDKATLLQMEDPCFSQVPARQQGLGAFLNRLIVQHLFAGQMHYASQPGQGLQARIEIPLSGTLAGGRL